MDEAEEMINLSVETDIQGYDIDEDMVKIAREMHGWRVWTS